MSRSSRPRAALLIAAFAIASPALLAAGDARQAPPADPAVLEDLAPTGELRVAIILSNSAFGVRDPGTGELRGPAIDLGSELARRLGVPFVAVPYAGILGALRDAHLGVWDVAFANIEQGPEVLDATTAGLMEVDSTYLVPPGSPIVRLADVDRPGVRISVTPSIVAADFLAAALEHAELVYLADARVDGLPALASGEVDVLTTRRPDRLEIAEQLPGSRVLDEGYLVNVLGMVVPRGRAAGLAYPEQFVEEVKAAGLVQQAIDRHDVRGIRVATRSAPASL